MIGSFIALNSVLHLSKHELDTMKVRFVDRNEETTAYKEYMKSPSNVNDGWFLWRTKIDRFRIGESGMCLMRLPKNSDLWLLTTIKTIVRELAPKGSVPGPAYMGEEWSSLRPFYGRLIIRYHKSRPVLVRLNTIIDDLTVDSILSSAVTWNME